LPAIIRTFPVGASNEVGAVGFVALFAYAEPLMAGGPAFFGGGM